MLKNKKSFIFLFSLVFTVLLISSFSSLALAENKINISNNSIYNPPEKRFKNSIIAIGNKFKGKSYNFEFTGSEKYYNIKTKKLKNGNINIEIITPPLNKYIKGEILDNGYNYSERNSYKNNRIDELKEKYDIINNTEKRSFKVYNSMPVYNKEGEIINYLDKKNRGNKIYYEYEINPYLQDYIKFGDNSILGNLGNNQVAYYKLDETSGDVVDATENNNDGSSNGGIIRGVTGKINNAFELDGTSGTYIDSNTQLNFGTGAFTLNIWVYPKELSSENKIFISNRNTTGGFIFSHRNQPDIRFWTNGDDLNADSLPLNEWSMVTAVRENDGTKYVYINGKQNATGSSTANVSSLQSAIIGSRPDDINLKNWNGTMDEIGLWDRALNSTEVSELYNNGDGITYPYTEPININVENKYPSNNSVNISITPELKSYVNHSNGSLTNVTFQYGESYNIEIRKKDQNNSKINNRDIQILDDGNKLLAEGISTDLVIYSLNNPYNISSLSIFSSLNFSESIEEYKIKDNGNELYIVDGEKIIRYSLSTPYDLSTASLNEDITLNSGENIESFDISDDGSKIYASFSLYDDDTDNNTIKSYSLSTPYDLSTFSLDSGINLNDGCYDDSCYFRELSILNNGEYFFISEQNNGNAGGIINEKYYLYELSTPYDINSRSLLYSENLNLRGEIANSGGFFYIDNGNRYYMKKDIGTDNNVNSGTNATITSSELDYETDYLWKARAIDSDGYTGESSLFTFTTESSPTLTTPTVSTNEATNTDIDSATLNGDITLNDYSSVDCYFRYRLNDSATWTETTKQNCSSDGSYSEDITGLTSSEWYEFEAVIEYDSTTEYGVRKEFETYPNPIVTSTISLDYIQLNSSPEGDININLNNYFDNVQDYTIQRNSENSNKSLTYCSSNTELYYSLDGTDCFNTNNIILGFQISDDQLTVFSSNDSAEIDAEIKITGTNKEDSANTNYNVKAVETIPYSYINSWEDFNNIRNNISKEYYLNTSLDENSVGYSTYGENFNIIEGEFSGSITGNNYTISDLGIRYNEDYVGLFRNLSGTIDNINFHDINISGNNYTGLISGIIKSSGEVKNIDITSTPSDISPEKSNIEGENYVGLISGENNGNINNIISELGSGLITGNDYIGGIVGDNKNIIDSIKFSSNAIQGGQYIGGISGYNSKNIINCNSNSYISGTDYIGGISGYNIDTINKSFSESKIQSTSTEGGGISGKNEGDINNCYSTGNVTGSTNVGGITATNNQLIKNCYVLSYVKSDLGYDSDGAIVSYGDNSGTVTNSFYNSETTGQGELDGDYAGAGISKTTSEMKNYSLYNNNGWDITTVPSESDRDNNFIWNIVDESSYPFLSYQIELAEDIEIISPILTNDINDFNISYNKIETIYLDDHFNNSENYSLDLNSSNGDYTNLGIGGIGESDSYMIEFDTGSSIEDIAKIYFSEENILKIETFDTNYSFSNVKIKAENNEGNAYENVKIGIKETSENPYISPVSRDLNPPILDSEINNFEIEINSELDIDFSNHFSDFNYTYLILKDLYANQDVKISEGENESVYGENGTKTSNLYLSKNSVLTLKTLDKTDDYLNISGQELTVYAINDDGKNSDKFIYSIVGEGEANETYTEPEGDISYSDNGFFSGIAESLFSLIPDSENIGTGTAIAIVFISIALITIILILVSHTSTGELPPSMLYLIIALDSLAFLFFIAIGYVPISIIIIIALVLIGLGYLKIRNTGGE